MTQGNVTMTPKDTNGANLAVIVYAKEDLRVTELPEPTPAPSQAVVEIAFGGICGSDLHYVSHGAAGASILKDPMVLGHEVVGTVLEAASDGSGPSVGTLVAVHPGTAHPDGDIPWPSERSHLAPGSTYLGSAARHPHTEGAFQRRVALESSMLRPLPNGLSLEGAALAEPAAVAWHAVMRAGRNLKGLRVAVIGAGPIGLLVAAVAIQQGAREVIVSDLAAEPLERATRLGAHRTVDARDQESIASLWADVVFESSGSVPGLQSAISAAVRGGTVVMVGLQRNGLVEAPLAMAITREVDLHGSFRFHDEMEPVLEALANGTLDVSGVVTHVFDVHEALEAFELAKDPKRSGKVLIDFRS